VFCHFNLNVNKTKYPFSYFLSNGYKTINIFYNENKANIRQRQFLNVMLKISGELFFFIIYEYIKKMFVKLL